MPFIRSMPFCCATTNVTQGEAARPPRPDPDAIHDAAQAQRLSHALSGGDRSEWEHEYPDSCKLTDRVKDIFKGLDRDGVGTTRGLHTLAANLQELVVEAQHCRAFFEGHAGRLPSSPAMVNWWDRLELRGITVIEDGASAALAQVHQSIESQGDQLNFINAQVMSTAGLPLDLAKLVTSHLDAGDW